MQLDKTKIAIRERGLLDIFDLSLHVFYNYAGPLLAMFAIGALAMFAINYALIGWMMDIEYREAYFYIDEVGTIARYVWAMTLLVTIEAPLASVFATAYLGQAVFVDRPKYRNVIIDVLKMSPRVVWCHLLVRGVLPAWLLIGTVERYSDFNSGIEGFLLPVLTLYALGLRYFRPFINEIILLERNPLTAKAADAMTIGRRSAQLHGPSSGDLFARGFATTCLSIALTVSVFSLFVFLSGVFLNSWKLSPLKLTIVLPLSMWLTSCFLAVVRFLSYLDLRIRHEGWEVELRMRAEAARLQSKPI